MHLWRKLNLVLHPHMHCLHMNTPIILTTHVPCIMHMWRKLYLVPHLMQMKERKLNLVPYLHIILNLHSTTISLATITINPFQYRPPHNLEAHQHFLTSLGCYFSCSRLVSLRWIHHLVYTIMFPSHKSHNSKYTWTNVGKDFQFHVPIKNQIICGGYFLVLSFKSLGFNKKFTNALIRKSY